MFEGLGVGVGVPEGVPVLVAVVAAVMVRVTMLVQELLRVVAPVEVGVGVGVSAAVLVGVGLPDGVTVPAPVFDCVAELEGVPVLEYSCVPLGLAVPLALEVEDAVPAGVKDVLLVDVGDDVGELLEVGRGLVVGRTAAAAICAGVMATL